MIYMLLNCKHKVGNLDFTSVCEALFLESGVTLNCSEPTTGSLLTAFNESIFNMAAVRPVNNLNTPTNVSISFTLYGILGVVSDCQFNCIYTAQKQ